MQYLVAGVLAGSMALFVGSARAADEMTIAVFTKNSTNPAYEAFRIAADQIGRSTGRESCTSFRSSPTMSTNRRRWWSRS